MFIPVVTATGVYRGLNRFQGFVEAEGSVWGGNKKKGKDIKKKKKINKQILHLATAPYGSNQAQGWQLGPITVTCS